MAKQHHVSVAQLTLGNDMPLTLIAGPCVMESRDHALETAHALAEIANRLGVGLIYKTSYDKANRTSLDGARGVGMKAALSVFAEIRESVGLPVLTDVHAPEQCGPAAEVVDVLQIPAFLCRQTDLLMAAAATGSVINVKKGQFLAPEDMASAIDKLESVGNKNILLCERGATFGYHRLVSDMRSIPIMSDLGYPVVFDAGHLVRIYGISSKDPRGGEPQFIPSLSRAGMAAGAHALFVETHPKPMEGLCDAASMYKLDEMEGLLSKAVAIHDLVQSWDIS